MEYGDRQGQDSRKAARAKPKGLNTMHDSRLQYYARNAADATLRFFMPQWALGCKNPALPGTGDIDEEPKAHEKGVMASIDKRRHLPRDRGLPFGVF